MLAENEEGKENELTGAVTAEPAVLSFSNRAEPWRFEEGMPCWVCLGKKVRARHRCRFSPVSCTADDLASRLTDCERPLPRHRARASLSLPSLPLLLAGDSLR